LAAELAVVWRLERRAVVALLCVAIEGAVLAVDIEGIIFNLLILVKRAALLR
jgi:hypothetical protein